MAKEIVDGSYKGRRAGVEDQPVSALRRLKGFFCPSAKGSGAGSTGKVSLEKNVPDSRAVTGWIATFQRSARFAGR